MCNHKVLSHNRYGYIIKCSSCRHYQVAFGTTVLCLSEEQYRDLTSHMNDQHELYKHDGEDLRKIIHLPTYCEHAFMVLNVKELKRFLVLVKEADLMAEVQALLINKGLSLN